MSTHLDVSQRLATWKIEATDPNNANYPHADLDEAIQRLQTISGLVTKLRTNTDEFNADDVVTLFGTLNSGNRMKNKVAKENPMPELRRKLLEMLDGIGNPIDKIITASNQIKYAGFSMLGELYGWVKNEEVPLYNSCAIDALGYLGYDVDQKGDAASYAALVASHEKFKQIYKKEVGQLRPDMPLNLEIDKLYNVIDKVDLKTNPSPKITTGYWRITLPDDWIIDKKDGGKARVNIWQPCLEHGIAAIGFDDDHENFQVKKFKSIQPGDKVVAFLLNKQIGGIGTVTKAYDAQLFEQRPKDQDYWDGNFWFRIGVKWQAVSLTTTVLPENTANMFYGSTIMSLSETQYADVMKAVNPDHDSAAFSGFSIEAFRFLTDLAQNNSIEWMQANKTRYANYVREPFRALFQEVGPKLKPVLDPFLIPDELEISPKSGKTLANINKRWAKGKDPYHSYYWGAFYRSSLKKQTDAQLFINMQPDNIRVGFYLNQTAKVYKQFRDRVLAHPNLFWKLITELEINDVFSFESERGAEGVEIITVSSEKDLSDWVAEGNFNLLRYFEAENSVVSSPQFADEVYDVLKQVFPVYLWAVADDWETAVEFYLSEGSDELDEDDILPELYDAERFLNTTHLQADVMEELKELLLDKKQIVLYGPPGTGKSFVAQELAKLLTELADPPEERVEMIQFHPAYSYEDFIEGIRPESKPTGDGTFTIDYPTKSGVFTTFCQNARKRPDKPHVFIIDEINRGNIARIFGELMLLLEYRQRSVPLPYSKKRFHIPENVYIIGTMNTADRSIALVDFALRRRFHFFYFKADPDLFEQWLTVHPVSVPYLATLYRALIEEEAIDDPDYAIGHSHFMKDGLSEAELRSIWRRSIEPYLREYYLENLEKAKPWYWDGAKVKQIREQNGTV